MGRGVWWLATVVAVAWAFSLAPALFVAGQAGVWISLLAGLVCLLPATGTWVVACWSLGQSMNRQMAAALAGSAIRMFVVIVLGGALLALSEALRTRWVLFVVTGIVYYLATLATETMLILAQRRRRAETQNRE